MERTQSLLGLALFLAVAPLAFTQDGTAQPCPDVTPGTLGCQLVAWSQLQEPVPLPEPETKPAPPREQQPGQSPNSETQPQSSKPWRTSFSPVQPGAAVRPPLPMTIF
jgi:hypothetical protein